MTFSPDVLLHSLQRMPSCTTALVALSGGLDSVVLLHALVKLRNQKRLSFDLHALHVNHGLHADAGAWQKHCEALCQQLDVSYDCCELDLQESLPTASVAASATKPSSATLAASMPPPGLENLARNARYAAFAKFLDADTVVLLAHHRDDQMETLLLRLLRGAGPRGLAGMPVTRELGAGHLFRPLLDTERRALLAYATEQHLHWIEDSANANVHFDRNYCRHTLLPLVAARWPGYRESWSKAATLQAEADELLTELAASDLQAMSTAEPNVLALDQLMALSRPRQRNLLRHWLQSLHLPEPGWHDLKHLTEAVLPAAPDAAGIWQAMGYSITRFRNKLMLTQQLAAIDPESEILWDPSAHSTCPLPHNGCLLLRPDVESARADKFAITVSGKVQVRYRRGGETCRLRGRPGKSLKKILQEHDIPPWVRARLPLIYAGDELIFVPGIGATEAAAKPVQEPGMIIEWQPPDWNPAPH